MFFATLLRILLIWWILTVLIKWIARGRKGDNGSRERSRSDRPDTAPEPGPDIVHSGSIDDADFEEIGGS